MHITELGTILSTFLITTHAAVTGAPGQSPSCFNCMDADARENCAKLRQCQDGEVCYFEVDVKRGKNSSVTITYSNGCTTMHNCEGYQFQPIGKGADEREVHKRDVFYEGCFECCNKDFCNYDMCIDKY